MLQSEIKCNLISNNFKEQFSFRSNLLHLFIYLLFFQIKPKYKTGKKIQQK